MKKSSIITLISALILINLIKIECKFNIKNIFDDFDAFFSKSSEETQSGSSKSNLVNFSFKNCGI